MKNIIFFFYCFYLLNIFNLNICENLACSVLVRWVVKREIGWRIKLEMENGQIILWKNKRLWLTFYIIVFVFVADTVWSCWCKCNPQPLDFKTKGQDETILQQLWYCWKWKRQICSLLLVEIYLVCGHISHIFQIYTRFYIIN